MAYIRTCVQNLGEIRRPVRNNCPSSLIIDVYTPRCHAYHHIVLGMYRDTDEGFRSGCLSWSSIRYYE